MPQAENSQRVQFQYGRCAGDGREQRHGWLTTKPRPLPPHILFSESEPQRGILYWSPSVSCFPRRDSHGKRNIRPQEKSNFLSMCEKSTH